MGYIVPDGKVTNVDTDWSSGMEKTSVHFKHLEISTAGITSRLLESQFKDSIINTNERTYSITMFPRNKICYSNMTSFICCDSETN
jgi:hypothetical protein